MTKSNLDNNLTEELEEVNYSQFISSDFRNKKLRSYAIRTIIAIILYSVFWKHEMVRWSLWFYVPLNLSGLTLLLLSPYFLKRKIEKTRKLVRETDELIKNSEEE